MDALKILNILQNPYYLKLYRFIKTNLKTYKALFFIFLVFMPIFLIPLAIIAAILFSIGYVISCLNNIHKK